MADAIPSVKLRHHRRLALPGVVRAAVQLPATHAARPSWLEAFANESEGDYIHAPGVAKAAVDACRSRDVVAAAMCVDGTAALLVTMQLA